MNFLVMGWGAIFGSFANVCIHRIPRGRSVAVPRSRCPKCFIEIAWYENVPIVSWIFLRGKCSGCGQKISVRYPAVEALTSFLFLWALSSSSSNIQAVLGCVVAFFLLVISVIDLDWRIIPDVLSLGLLGAGLILAPVNPVVGHSAAERAVSSLIGAGVGYSTAWIMLRGGRWIFKKEALGGGDVKLLAAMGAVMGWRGVLAAWLVGSVLGTLIFSILKLRRKMHWGDYLPFGPFLAAGAWVHWIWPGFIPGVVGF